MVIIILIATGVMLFYLRAQNTPHSLSHELNIKAKKSTHKIYPHQFLILVRKENTDRLNDILAPLTLKVQTPILNWILVESKKPYLDQPIELESEKAIEAQQTLNSLLSHPLVLDAHHNYVIETSLVPDNWFFTKKWYLEKLSSSNKFSMNLPQAWEKTQGAKDINISVVDEFSFNNNIPFKDIFNECSERVNFYQPFSWLRRGKEFNKKLPHGEIMLHVIGACSNEETYTLGLNWHSPINAIERPSRGHAETFLAALYASQIDVCSESIIHCPKQNDHKLPKLKPHVLLLPFANSAPDLLQFSSDIIERINRENIIVVSPAGNDSKDASNSFPGGTENVITVGASDSSGYKTKFSNWGSTIDTLAPGDKVELTYPNGPKIVSGTSISAAYVFGLISLLKSIDKSLNYSQIKHILKISGNQISCKQYCPKNDIYSQCNNNCCHDKTLDCGLRIVNATKAIESLLAIKTWPAMLNLEQQYLLFLRDETKHKSILLKNTGNEDAKVSAVIFNDNVEVIPKSFLLGKAGSKHSEQPVLISLKEEPFKRTTFKLVFEENGNEINKVELFIEYIPKR